MSTNQWNLKKLSLIAASFGVLAVIVVFITLSLLSQPATPAEVATIAKTINFNFFYPQPLPANFRYSLHSAENNNGVVIFSLNGSQGNVTISEQAIPAAPPDLLHLAGFTPLQVAAGNAAIGKSLNQTIAIVMNNTTLITINGGRTTPPDAVRDLATNLRSLP